MVQRFVNTVSNTFRSSLINMKCSLILITLMAAVSAIPAPFQHHHESELDTNTFGPTADSVQTSIPDTTADANTAAATADNGHSRSHGGHHTSSVATASPTVQVTATAKVTNAGVKTTTAAANRASASASASAASGKSGSIDPSLVPEFGQQAGLHPDGTGNCKADSGTTIPCKCPPDRDAFISKLEEFVNAGSFFGLLAAPFPTSNSNQDALTRIDTIISTLQNFDGSSGAGCPAASAPNFSSVQCNLLRATGGSCNSPSAGG